MKTMRLRGSGLGCSRGNREVFHNISFDLSQGEVLALSGPNGAGKSSLLRVIAGLLAPSAGRLDLEGCEPGQPIGELALYLGHQDALKPSLSVSENLMFWVRYLGGDGQGMREALSAVGLDPLCDLPAAYLSAGQRRRLAIARLLVTKRPIWLLDEPLTALDAAAQGRVAELMRGHLDGGGLIVAATHGPLGIEVSRQLTLGGQ